MFSFLSSSSLFAFHFPFSDSTEIYFHCPRPFFFFTWFLRDTCYSSFDNILHFAIFLLHFFFSFRDFLSIFAALVSRYSTFLLFSFHIFHIFFLSFFHRLPVVTPFSIQPYIFLQSEREPVLFICHAPDIHSTSSSYSRMSIAFIRHRRRPDRPLPRYSFVFALPPPSRYIQPLSLPSFIFRPRRVA